MFDFMRPSFWFKKRESVLGGETVRSEQLARFNALYGCDPDKVASAVTAFACGYLGPVARIVEEFERRDDKMVTCAMKMKASVGRCDYQILVKEGFENDPRAKLHADTLKRFWSTVKATDRFKLNERGGFRLLRKQMMDAQSYGFAVHEIVWTPMADGSIRAEFIKMPLWHFENKTGELRFLKNANASDGVAMAPGEWLVTTGDGVGIAASIVAMAKRLSFQDWLLFSERSGMPIIIGKTGAAFGSDQWNRLKGLISAIYRDTRALVDNQTSIEAIQTGSTANLPFPALVEWADRAIAALYRGADLSTISKGDGTGASLQGDESGMLEQDAVANLGEALHEQVDRFVIRYVTGDEEPLAYISIEPVVKPDVDTDIKIDKHLSELGVKLSKRDALQRYGRIEAESDDDALELKMSGQELPSEPATSGLSLDQLASLIYPLKAAGYTIEKRQLEQATKLKLEETADPNAQPAEPGLANEERSQPTDEEQKSDQTVLAAFAQDTGPAADAIQEFLKAPSKEAAEALLKRLPDLLPEDPAMAAVIAEAMAKEFGKTEKLANMREYKREQNGQFAEVDHPTDFKPGKNPDSAETQAAEIGKGKKAIEKCLAEKCDVPNAVSRGDVGLISLVYTTGGDDPRGLVHFLERPEARAHLAETLVRGEAIGPYQDGQKLNLKHGGYVATLRLTSDEKAGLPKNWVLSGYGPNDKKKGSH